jgi:hypothetical protein
MVCRENVAELMSIDPETKEILIGWSILMLFAVSLVLYQNFW